MQYQYVSIAGCTIKISLYPSESPFLEEWFDNYLSTYFADFLLHRQPKRIDYYLDIKWDKKEEMIVREKESKYYLHLFTKKGSNKIVTNYQISTNQFQILLRYILHSFLLRDSGFLLHASSVLIGNKAYLFTGKSGAGKSTAAGLLRKKFPRISDDIIIVKKIGKKFIVYQTPIREKNPPNQINKNPIPLEKIFLLKKAKNFSQDPVKNKIMIFERLLKQVFIIKHDDVRVLTSVLADLLEEPKMIYTLSFAKDEKKMIEFFSKFDHEIQT